MNEFKAVIFDLDDTLVATAMLWRRAESALLLAMGKEWEAGLASRHRGMNALDVATVIHGHYRPSMSLEEARGLMRGKLIGEFKANPPVEMRGAVECVRRAGRRGHRLAVASGSPREAIGMALEGVGILGEFEKVISSESVARGKPWPDVYLKAAESLGLEARECVAVEDTLIGAMAARDAGMECLLVPSNAEAWKADWAGVRMVESLEELFAGGDEERVSQ